MATSGSKTVNVAAAAGSYTDGVRLKLSWQELSQSIANNTTTIRLTLQVITGKYGAMYGSASKTWKISCGSKSVSKTFTIQQGNNTTRTLGTLDVTISHASNGTGSFSASFSAQFDMDFNGWVGTKSGTLSGTLDTIPRASTPSVSGTLQLGNAITINTNRASSAFTHTLTWSWAGKSGTIATGVGASTKWTPPVDTFAPYLPNATSATCTITCVTYNGSTNLGSKTKTFTLAIPSSVVPSISAITPSDAAGLLALYGAYVQGKSNLKAAITAAGIYGSTISKYEASMDGLAATGNPATLGAPPTAGTRTITAKVTDTRGRTASKTAQITVAEYFAPTLDSCMAYRYDTETKEESDESTTIYAAISGSVCNVNKSGSNTSESAISYRVKNAASWKKAASWPEMNAGTGDVYYIAHGITIPNCSEANRYEIKFSVTDAVGSTVELILEVGTAQPVIDLKGDGEGMALFAIADQLGIKMGKPVYIAKESGIKFEADDGTWLDAIMPQSNGRPKLANHTALANGIWLQGLLASGAASNILRVNESGQVELNWTSGGMRGRVLKTLWSGSMALGGTATIPELPYYNVILVTVDQAANKLILFREKGNDVTNSFSGLGAMPTGDQNNNIYMYSARLYITNGAGTAVKLSAYARYQIYTNSITKVTTDTINYVEGLL